MLTPSHRKLSVNVAEHILDPHSLSNSQVATGKFQRRSKSIVENSMQKSVLAAPYISLLRVDTKVAGLHQLKQKLKFPALADPQAVLTSRKLSQTTLMNRPDPQHRFKKTVSRSYLLGHEPTEMQTTGQHQAKKRHAYMTAIQTTKINEGRHKQTMAFNDESAFSIMRMINYQNNNSEIAYANGKLKVDSNYDLTQTADPFRPDTLISDQSILKINTTHNPVYDLQQKRENHRTRLSNNLPQPRKSDFSTGMLEASEMLRDNLVKSQLIEQYDLNISPVKHAKGAFIQHDPQRIVKQRNSISSRFKSHSVAQDSTTLSQIPETRDGVVSPLYDKSIQFIINSMTKVVNDEITKSQQSMSDEDEKGGGARLRFGSSSLAIIDEDNNLPMTQPVSPTKARLNSMLNSPHTSRLDSGDPHKVKTVATAIDSVKQQTAAATLNQQKNKPLFPTITARQKFERKMNSEKKDKNSKEAKAAEEEKKKRLRNLEATRHIREEEAEYAKISHLIDVDMEAEIEQKVQKVYKVLNQKVAIDKEYMSFSEINQAYQNKIMMTGQAIANVVIEEKNEVDDTLKIIDFQQKLQRDNTTYLGYQGYDKVKAVYERIQKQKQDKTANAIKDRAKQRLDALNKAFDATSDNRTKDSKPGSMLDALEKAVQFQPESLPTHTVDNESVKAQTIKENSDVNSILASAKVEEAAASEVQKEKSPAKPAMTKTPIIDDEQEDGAVYEYPRKKKSNIIPGKMSELEITDPGPVRAMPEALVKINTAKIDQLKGISNLEVVRKSPSLMSKHTDFVDETQHQALEEETSSMETDEELASNDQQKKKPHDYDESLENYKVYKDQKIGEYTKRQSMEEIIATKKIYPMMRDFNFVYSSKVAEEYESYDIEQFVIKKFIRTCHKFNKDTDEQNSKINPFPLLHQAYQGRLLLRNQDFKKGVYSTALEAIVQLENAMPEVFPPLHTLYLEGNKVADDELASMIRTMTKIQELREVVLLRTRIGPKTQVALNMMQKEKLNSCFGFFLHFESCEFSEFKPELAKKEDRIPSHPMLISNLATVKHITLINQRLDDSLFEKLFSRAVMLETLDISFNRFSPKELLKFLKKLTDQNYLLMLKSLSLAGNSLSVQETPLIDETLNQVIKIPGLQHLDLSLTKIEANTQEKLIKCLLIAETLVSLHLTSHSVEHLRSLSLKHLQEDPVRELLDRKIDPYKAEKAHRLINRMSRVQGEQSAFDAKWNDDKRIPNRHTVDITGKVKRCIAHLERRSTFCQHDRPNEHTAPKPYWEQTYILSRIIGRKECDLMCSKQQEVEIHNEDFEIIAQTCWIESRECWHCERWNYLLPVVTKEEIEATFAGTDEQKELCLTRQQKQIFDRIVDFNGELYGNLKCKVPYIVGTQTEYFLKPMDKWADFMLNIDPKADRVKKKFEDQKEAIQAHYNQNWKPNVFEAVPDSSHEINNPLSMKKKNRALKKAAQDENGPTLKNSIWPYNPKFERKITPGKDSFNQWDSVWTYPTMCTPGKHTYFIVCKIDEKKTFITQIETVVEIRANPIHYYKMQLPQRLFQKMQERQKNRVLYFDVFSKWRPDVHSLLDQVFQQDCKMWPLKRKLFGIKNEAQIDEVKKDMGQYLEPLFTIYKHLTGLSESYPLCGFKEIRDWVKHLNIIDNRFTMHTLTSEFSQTKSFDYRRDQYGRVQPIKQDQKLRAMLVGIDSKTNPQNEFTRSLFFEFVLRLALHKFIRTKKKIGAKKEEAVTPLDCLHKFMQETVLPAMGKTLSNYQKLANFKDEQVFRNNEELKKMMFINQFQLKQIYDSLLDQQQSTDYSQDLLYASPFDMSSATLKKQATLATLKATFGSGEPGSPKSPRSPMSHGGSENGQSDFDRDGDHSPKNVALATDGEDLVGQSSPLPSFQMTGNKMFQSMMEKTNQKTKKRVMHEKPTLKALDLPKGLHLVFLLHRFQRLLPDVTSILDIKLFRKCVVHAKQTSIGYGENRKHFEMNVDRDSRLTFVEFQAFICMLAKMVYSPTQNQIGNEAFNEDVRHLLKALFANIEGRTLYFEEPGLQAQQQAERKQEVLVGGTMTTYRDPTPVNQRRSIMPEFNSTQQSIYTQVDSD